MALLDLKTDLKSLKYGQDQPGGGSSRQPYIVTDINTVDSGINRLRFTKFDDGLIRGGAVGTANAAIVDTLRISKFLTDAPQGPLFIIKQVGLQLSNPRLESTTQPANRPTSGQGFLNNAINFVSNVATGIQNAIGPTRIYNLGLNTLAQVPVNALGGHIMRHGLLPNNDESKLYYNVVTEKNFRNNTNRLVDLTNKFKLGDRQPNDTQNQQLLNAVSTAANAVAAAFGGPQVPFITTNPEQQTIDKYLGGPGSVYGIGNTLIKRSDYTEDGFFIKLAFEDSKTYAGYTRDGRGSQAPIDYTRGLGTNSTNTTTLARAIENYPGIPTGSNEIKQGIINVSSTDPLTNFKNPSLRTYALLVSQIEQQQDPENVNNAVISGSGNFATGYVNQFGIYKIERNGDRVDNTKGHYQDISYGTIGYENSYGEIITVKGFNKWSAISREARVGSGRTDLINLTPTFTENRYFGDDNIVAIDGQKHYVRDLVKFRIQAVNTDKPNSGEWMAFRAYLTSFSDNVDAKWNDINYVGRGNPFYIYTGFTRKIQVGFKVAALSAEEMKPMYSKLNNLMASLMPDYKNNLMRGPLHRLMVGNYIDGQLGKLDSISYTIPNDSPWEISLDEPEGGSKQLILPHIIEVQMSFTPIGADTQQQNKLEAKSGDISFIAQNNTGDDTNTIQYYNDYIIAQNITSTFGGVPRTNAKKPVKTTKKKRKK